MIVAAVIFMLLLWWATGGTFSFPFDSWVHD
jgi:hypothetical protein